MARIRGKDRRDFNASLQGIVNSISGLDTPAARAIMPVLAQAQAELEADLRGWRSGEDGEATFTTQRMRNALVQIRRGMETLKLTEPALLHGIRIGSRTAGQLATNHIEEELLRFGSLFDGSISPVSLDTAIIIAKGDTLMLAQHAGSARRYHTHIRETLIREMAVGKLRGETVEQIGNRLEQALPHRFGQFRRRAHMVARTEVMNAYNTFHRVGLEQAAEDDPEIRMRWDASYDYRRCPHCASLDGKFIEVGGRFEAKWTTTNRKRKTRTHTIFHRQPPAHPSCRCILVAWRSNWEMPGRPEPTDQPIAVGAAA